MVVKLRTLRQSEDWAALMQAQAQVLQLSRTSQARRDGLLLVFEASCARKETTVTSLFNRLVIDYPDTQAQAVELCRHHLPDQVFDRQ